MHAQSLPAAPNDRAAQVAEDLDTCRQLLMELAQIAMCRIRALDEAPPTSTGKAADTTAQFNELSRNLRYTIMLAEDLAKPRLDKSRADKPCLDAEEGRVAARKRIIRDVEDRIDLSVEPPRSERLHAEFRERLDRPGLERDLATRPLADIIADICRDLGVEPKPVIFKWKRRTPDDIDLLEAVAAAPSAATPSAARSPGPWPVPGDEPGAGPRHGARLRVG